MIILIKIFSGNILLFKLIEIYKSKNFIDFDLTIGDEIIKNYLLIIRLIYMTTLIAALFLLYYLLGVKFKLILKR